MNDDPFAPVSGAGARRTANVKPKWISVAPVPADAARPPATHPTLGEPSRRWSYTDATGAVLGYMLRFEPKTFRPLTLWRNAATDKLEWRWESWPPKRPLYGLQRLAERPSAPVVIIEGEKAADAAARLLPGFVAVTSPNGSKSAGKADWSPLKGRALTVLWPDADTAGREYARQVAKLATAAGAAAVTIVSPPGDVKVGWDAADALAEGWTIERAAELVAAAVPADQIVSNKTAAAERDETSEHAAPGGRRRTPQRDVLIGLTEFVELWHDAGRTAYASFTVNDHREHWPVRSRDFRMWLSGRFFEATGTAIGGQALEDGVRILECARRERGAAIRLFQSHRRRRRQAVSRFGRSDLARRRNHRGRLGGHRQSTDQIPALAVHARAAGARTGRHDRGATAIREEREIG